MQTIAAPLVFPFPLFRPIFTAIFTVIVASFSFCSIGVIAPGCAAASKILASLPTVATDLQDASLVLNQILSIASALSQSNPSIAATVAKVQQAVAAAQQSLAVVVKISATATDLSDANYQAAITDFSTAFATVVQLAQQIGIDVNGSSATAPTTTKPAAIGTPLHRPHAPPAPRVAPREVGAEPPNLDDEAERVAPESGGIGLEPVEIVSRLELLALLLEQILRRLHCVRQIAPPRGRERGRGVHPSLGRLLYGTA